jgi:hypothetical protein
MIRIVHPDQSAFLARFADKPQILHAPIIAEAPFVTHYGAEVLEPVYAAPRSAYRLVEKVCSRCSGMGGAEAWKRTGFTCYKCHGDGGKRMVAETVYTREQYAKRQAKLDAAKAARDAKKGAKEAAAKAGFAEAHADLIALVEQIKRPSDFLSSIMSKGWMFGRLSEAQAAAAREAAQRELSRQQADATSQHIGIIGRRIEIEGVITFTATYETRFGTTYVTGIKDKAGNIYIQKGVAIGAKGEEVNLLATVKEHATRDGVKQTIISRPKMI